MSVLEKKHNRKLGIIGTHLVAIRFCFDEVEVLMEIQDEVECLIDSANYLQAAPFDCVTIAHRIGLKNDEEPKYQPINKKYGDLPLSIESDANELREAERFEFKRHLLAATLRALIHAGLKFGLPTEELAKRLEELQ